jgi:hypothetical protein
VWLFDDPLPKDPDLTDHQQAEISHEVGSELGVIDVVTVNVEPEILTLQCAPICEVDLEIKLDAPILA